MQTTNMLDDLKNIMKEGWLEKESRVFKTWRKRWFVLTTSTLYTFKSEKQYILEKRLNYFLKRYRDPTEVISLKQVSTIKSCDDETKRENSFKIDSPGATYFMIAMNNQDKEQWIGAIGKAMVKLNIKKNSFEDD